LKLVGVVAASALMLALAAQSQTSVARERPGAAARQGQPRAGQMRPRENRPPVGRDWTRSTTTTRTENGFTRNTTVTNDQGQTATRNMTVSRDRDAGTQTVDISRTGFDGRTSSVHREAQRTETGRTINTTITNANGETATRSVEITNDREAGVRTREAELTTFDGRTGSLTSVTTRTDNGVRTETTGTLPNGELVNRVVERSCDKATKSCTKTVTNDGDGG
jgi:hypothetical protein